jgi:hypothetical protein
MMLESLQDRLEASYLVAELASQIIMEESEVAAKLHYIQRTVTHARDSVAVEDAQRLRHFMLAPDTAKYFTGAAFSPHDGTYQAVAATNTDAQLSAITSYVAASSLVFAHSFLEFVLETLLRMTRLCDIGSWLPFISSKNIPISVALDSELESVVEAKLNDFVAALHKEGLMDKIQHLAKLLKRSITTSSIINYTYEPKRLSGLDSLRHELAHHRKKDYSIQTAEADITYLYRTAFHFLDLVVHTYELYGANRPKTTAGA